LARSSTGRVKARARTRQPGVAFPCAERSVRAERGRDELQRRRDDAQQQQMRAINQKYQGEEQTLRTAMRPAMDEARTARQRGDSAAARAVRERTADQRRQFAALQERHVAEVRGVLTAEQQRQFDANRTEMQARMQERRGEPGARGKRQGRGRGGREG